MLLVGVGLAAFHFWSGSPQAVRAPEPVRDAAVASASEPLRLGGQEPAPRSAAGPTADGQVVVVDVSGKVRRPGVHRLPHGARVADALRASGGVRAGTDLSGLNRARVLVDGEQIVVGLPLAPTLAGAGTGGVPTGGTAGRLGPATPLSLNGSTKEQLETLPGVGPVLAQHIIDHRTERGGFRSVDELRQVDGIGDRRFADLQPLVRP
ncbi:helix-hairpin-helix domain-containing protein [Streptomyces sp. NPDC088729]|uniref:helix-hairpin-helix domain-containing protein n=1 Tax=Streptomyces sp. NPDC088729 TaxID=3365876 RepID=UPI0037FE01CD